MLHETSHVDLEELVYALADRDRRLGHWYLHRGCGEVMYMGGRDPNSTSMGIEGWILVHPLPVEREIGDMDDFAAFVPDPDLRYQLQMATMGETPVSSFRAILRLNPRVERAWCEFYGARMRRRAINWLAERRIVQRETIEQLSAQVRARPTMDDLFGEYNRSAAS